MLEKNRFAKLPLPPPPNFPAIQYSISKGMQHCNMAIIIVPLDLIGSMAKHEIGM